MWLTLWVGAHLATKTGGAPYGAIRDGAVDGRLACADEQGLDPPMLGNAS